MKFLLMCCFNEEAWERIPQPEKDEVMRDYGEWIQALEKTGQHLASARLQPVASARTLRQKGGKPMVTDGPFAETKEQLGGYHLIECANHDEAVAVATRIPTLRVGGTIELRPLAQTF